VAEEVREEEDVDVVVEAPEDHPSIRVMVEATTTITTPTLLKTPTTTTMLLKLKEVQVPQEELEISPGDEDFLAEEEVKEDRDLKLEIVAQLLTVAVVLSLVEENAVETAEVTVEEIVEEIVEDSEEDVHQDVTSPTELHRPPLCLWPTCLSNWTTKDSPSCSRTSKCPKPMSSRTETEDPKVSDL